MKKCPSCSKLVPRGHGFKRSQQYCSYACYRFKTPKMVEVEEAYGRPLRDVMVEVLNASANMDIASELLGIQRQQLHQWATKLKVKRVIHWEIEDKEKDWRGVEEIKYHDTNRRAIKAGLYIEHKSGNVEEVFECGQNDLGIRLWDSELPYLEEAIIPLHQLDLGEWALISVEEAI